MRAILETLWIAWCNRIKQFFSTPYLTFCMQWDYGKFILKQAILSLFLTANLGAQSIAIINSMIWIENSLYYFGCCCNCLVDWLTIPLYFSDKKTPSLSMLRSCFLSQLHGSVHAVSWFLAVRKRSINLTFGKPKMSQEIVLEVTVGESMLL